MEEEKIWNYYKTIAGKIGRDKEGKEKGFSVSWFYDRDFRQYFEHGLNKLTKAFLGDMTSLEAVIAVDEPELASMRSRVHDICGNAPYPAQVDAIARAILNDITIIQGPPGTGKTETIKNILLCLRTVRPESKIAVISSNNEAISNAEEAIRAENSLCSSYARLGRKKVREEFKKKLEIDNLALYEQLESCGKDNDWQYPQIFLDAYPIIFSTIHSLRKCVDIDEYDYVIVDECSQVPSMIGMIAIASAKHLILLGDNEQLPPIHKDDENESIDDVQEIRQAAAWYLDEKDNSFMKACEAVFGDRCGNVLLNEHYRCHPAIIEFCNREIYGNRLLTRTADDGKLPVRIRWYEGDYWEKIDASETERTKNYNRKQIQVFIRDEYPEIKEILRNNHDYGICVLAPYRCQLEELKRCLDDIPVEAAIPIENEIEQSEDGVNDVAQLTIHKAQGRGFERVYIMPVEDTGSHPWSQRKELINVAVSRAKKELCVITSAHWMSEEMQKSLLEYAVTNGRELGHDRYIQKLLSYVEKAQKTRDTGLNYGFQKASMESVFDKTLYYRSRYNYEKKESLSAAGISASEYCMLHALNDCPAIRNRYEIYREVMLKEIEGISCESDDVKEYIENDARFDIVIAKKNGKGEGSDIQAVIEIDGAYHRSDPDMARKDELKDQAVASLGADFATERYFRFPTDGTTENEIEKILAALRQSDLKYGKLSAGCDEKIWRDGRLGKGIVALIMRDNERTDNALKIMIEYKRYPEYSIRSQIEELLGERQMQLPAGQHYIKAEFENESFSRHLPATGARIILYLKPNDFITREVKIGEDEQDYIFLRDRVAVDDCEYIEYGREDGPRHIVSKPYYFLQKLTYDIGNQLKEGKLYELMMADERFVFADEESAQEDPGRRYNNILQNNYFVLRHAFAYFWVYYQMFSSLLRRLPDGPIRLHILSIGCGSKIDALGLKQALRHCGKTKIEAKSKYIGIDAGIWNESEYFLYLNDEDEYFRLKSSAETDETYVKQEIGHIRSLRNALDEFQNREGEDGEQAVYLVVFPNSISEIEVEEFENLLYCIRRTYAGKKLYICLSKNINNTDETLSIDYQQVEAIRMEIGDPLVIDEEEQCMEDALEKEVFGATRQKVKYKLFNVWEELNIGKYLGDDSEIDFDKLMENEIIKKALECVSGQKREERKCDIRWKAQDIVGAVKKTNKRKGTNYKPYLLKNPVNDLDRYIEYQIYEVPEQ